MCADTPEYMSRPGTFLHLRTLPDNTPVVLDGMRVAQSGIPIIRIKDPWSGRDTIAVDVGLREIEEFTSVEITGCVATVDGEKTVVVTRIRQYLTKNGHPFLMMPKPVAGPIDWPYMREIPVDESLQVTQFPSQDPYRLTMQPSSSQSGGMQLLSEPISSLGMVAMTNRSAAAGAQHGGDGLVPGVTTTDRLVKCWGKVTAHDTSGNAFFYINDGSAVDDGSPYSGLRINWPFAGIIPPAADSLVTVKGTSDTELVNGKNIRALIPAETTDVHVVSPADTTDPTLTVANVAGGELHFAHGTGSITLRGTARDLGSGISAVEIKLTPTAQWQTVNYSFTTQEWSYTWSTPQAAELSIRATDFAGNHSQEDVAVSPVSVVYVVPNGTGDGSSWANATGFIQAGIDAAALMTPNKGEVWVKEFHSPTGSEPDPDQCYREYQIDLEDEVALYGGFAGAETVREARDGQANVTTICGTISASGLGAATALDGFLVVGGGVSCVNSYLTLANNVIRYNENASAGVCCVGGGPSIIDNDICDNTAGSLGGGISCSGGSPRISRNIIHDNVASQVGAGIYCDSAQARISNNVVRDNTCSGYGTSGGGIYVAGGNPEITNNTIRGNTASDGGGVFVAGGTPHFGNNIVALNSSGVWYATGSQTYISNNDVFGNGTADYLPASLSGTQGNISADPLFLIDGFHIPSVSPCAGAGDITLVEANETDIDAEPRVHGSVVDIGADQYYCGKQVLLTASQVWAEAGQSIQVTATVKDKAGNPLAGETVAFSILPPAAICDPPTAQTDANGIAETDVSFSSGGRVVVTASVSDDCGTFEAFKKLTFCGPNLPPVDMFFVLDCTANMWVGPGYHGGQESVKAFVTEMTNDYGIPIRAGGVKLNDPVPWWDSSPDSVNMAEFASISTFSNISSFISEWLDDGYQPRGGDGRDLQLDGLHYAAQDMILHSTSSRRYIVLVSDYLYHAADIDGLSPYTASGIAAELSSADPSPGEQFLVYISLWSTADPASYQGMLNGGEFDPPNASGDDTPGNWKYPLARLRAAILNRY